MNNILRSLAWLFFGASVSVLARLYIQPPLPVKWLCILLSATIISFLWGAGILSKMWQSIILWRREGNRLFPAKMGILTTLEEDQRNEEIYACTDVTPTEWKKEIERWAKEDKIRIKVDLVDVGKTFDSYVAILNPYGGSYPENDIRNFETLKNIFDYVKKGGLFVNVADIPGYWAYNPLLKRRLDATRPIYSIGITPEGKEFYRAIRLFELTPFMERLGLRVFNTEKDDKLSKWDVSLKGKFNKEKQNIGEIRVHRVVVVERNVETIIEPKDEKTPIFIVNYGEGVFLISLVFFNKEYPQNYKIKEMLAKIIIDLLRKEVSAKRSFWRWRRR